MKNFRTQISFAIVLCVIGLELACSKIDLIEPSRVEISHASDSITFAIIGDYGKHGEAEGQVADLVDSWNPDFILTTGDNNYSDGEFATLNKNIGFYYSDYIFNFDAPQKYQCNARASEEGINRFFPTPGNHDTYSRYGLTPYLNYFTLPGNERYYHFNWGAISFYALNSTENMDEQFLWLEDKLASDTAAYQVVYFHHCPYSPGRHGNQTKVQWDYQEHGVELVISGHEHFYARIEKKDEPDVHYLVNGAGGKALYSANENPLNPNTFSVFTYDQNYGAIRCVGTSSKLKVEFFSISDNVKPVDSFTILRISN